MTTTPRHTLAHALASVIALEDALSARVQPPTGDDYNDALGFLLPFRAVAGRPFHMAADLLGVSPALLSGTLDMAADSERDLAFGAADDLERASLSEGSHALRTAAAMYQAENAPAITPADVGPGMTNAALAYLLDNLPLASLSELDRAALDEAAQRIRERQDEEEA